MTCDYEIVSWEVNIPASHKISNRIMPRTIFAIYHFLSRQGQRLNIFPRCLHPVPMRNELPVIVGSFTSLIPVAVGGLNFCEARAWFSFNLHSYPPHLKAPPFISIKKTLNSNYFFM